MASIRSLGDGRWQVRVFVDRDDGPPLRPSKIVHARNRSQAEQKANAWLAELRSSGRVDFKKRTVSDAVDAWVEACGYKGLSPGTMLGYQQHIDALKRDLGDRPLDKLTAQEVQAYYRRLTAQGKKVSHRHAALRAALGEAMHQGWVSTNVAKLTRRLPEPVKRHAPPNVDEIGHLIKVAYGRSEEAGNFVVVSIGTGMRRGEVAAMRASRVDWDDGVYLIDSALSAVRDDKGLIVKAPKTNQVRRMPLSDAVDRAVRRQIGLLERRAAAARVGLVVDPWLWSADADAGRPRHPDWFSKEFAACREAAGVSARLHDLRHAAATIWVDQGVPIPVVSELLGHANPHTTMSIYAHGVSVRGREAAELLGRAFQPAGELEA